jgi:hypothetical protein
VGSAFSRLDLLGNAVKEAAPRLSVSVSRAHSNVCGQQVGALAQQPITGAGLVECVEDGADFGRPDKSAD